MLESESNIGLIGNNAYYSDGADKFRITNTYYTDSLSYQTAFPADSNSVFGSPHFYSDFNLNNKGNLLNDLGDTSKSLATDFHVESRLFFRINHSGLWEQMNILHHSPDVCDSYTSPSGKVWTMSNIYLDTIMNVAGCDSLMTINLTICYSTLDTISTLAGCDSVVVFTVNNSSISSISPTVCDSYTSLSGLIPTSEKKSQPHVQAHLILLVPHKIKRAFTSHLHQE